VTVSTTRNLDDLELELRKLPGVRAAGFIERDDLLVVQVQVAGGTPAPSLSQQAARIAYRHADKPIALEVVRWRTVEVPVAAPVAEVAPPPTPAAVDAANASDHAPAGDRGARVRLLAVLTFPDTDELEVHLILDGRRTIGRSSTSNGLLGAVQATLGAVRELGATFEPTALWARQLDSDEDERVVVAVALGGVVEDAPNDYGIAAGASEIDAAARSTLDALNRRLAQVL
jgi:hypothetical protein